MSDNKEIIACPICDWEPDTRSLWYCTCSCTWNTFSTAGVCPSCKKRWQTTQCLSCRKHSPHVDWYRSLPDIIQYELDNLKQHPIKTVEHEDKFHNNPNDEIQKCDSSS